jgi:hypothetical protein
MSLVPSPINVSPADTHLVTEIVSCLQVGEGCSYSQFFPKACNLHLVFFSSSSCTSIYRAGRGRSSGSILGRGKRCLPFPKLPERFWGLPIILFNGEWRVSLGLKWPQREADHLHPPSADVASDWSYISSLPSVCLYTVNRHNFCFGLYQALILAHKWILRLTQSFYPGTVSQSVPLLFGQCSIRAMHRFSRATYGFWEGSRRRGDIFLTHCRRFISWFMCSGK